MIALIQRVSGANIQVEAATIAEIGIGLLVLAAVERGDGPEQASKLAARLCAYRVFPDAAGKMNRSVRDVGGSLLLVPQFTLAADTKSGTRAGFSTAASPEDGLRLFALFVEKSKKKNPGTKAGQFGADMKVSLVNDGPVTFWLQASPTVKERNPSDRSAS